MAGEESANNNITRLVNVDQRKPRILYLEGEPRWEFKFLRRAVEDDRTIDLVTILRTTQNKIYRQGISESRRTGRTVSHQSRGTVRVRRNHFRQRGRALSDARPTGRC